MKAPAWKPLPLGHRFDAESLHETLVGGQAFRWKWDAVKKTWTGIWGENVAQLRLLEGSQLEARPLSSGTSLEAIRDYLATDRLPVAVASLPCGADPVLERLRVRWQEISLLRQPPGETLLAFICSSNKQILQIRSMLEALATRFGKALTVDSRSCPPFPLHALPDWAGLHAVPEDDLRKCALGYRARHVAGTASFLKEHPDFLERLPALPTGEARSALLQLPGVGPKVADCVLLFGLGRLEAFPVDTWIHQILVRLYPELEGWKREQLATFARIHYGKAAGLAQQWLFAEARKR